MEEDNIEEENISDENELVEESTPQEETINKELEEDNGNKEISLKENVEELTDIPDEINEDEQAEEDEEKVADENEELKKINENIKKLLKNNPKLLNRVENKYDFVVETVNAPSNQKLSNLEEYEINQLLKRREFLNYLKMHGKIWSLVAQLVERNVCDIENYSLSKKGFLPKLSLIENVRQYSLTHSAELKKLRREDAELV